MEMIIGLFCDKESAQGSIRKLQEAGFPKDKINLISRESDVRKLMENCDCRSHFMAKCVLSTAILGMIMAAPASFAVSMIVCANLGLGWGPGLISALILIATGGALGASFGCFFGADAEERGICHCCQKINAGGQAVAVMLSHHQGEIDVWRILEQAQAEEIKTMEGIEETVFNSLASNRQPGPLYP